MIQWRAMKLVTLRTGLVAVALGLAAVSCAAPPPAARVASVKPGALPDGGSWSGVWYNAQFGNLHLVEKDGAVTGRWKAAAGHAWGQLTGKPDGNVLKFTWIEHKIGMVGPAATMQGKGYFVYTRPEGDHVDDELKGEWGLNDSETGNGWDCVHQRNVKPDPGSIGGVKEIGGPGGWE